MVHRGKRSKIARELRDKREYILSLSYRDHELAETVSTVTVDLPVRVWRKDGSYFYVANAVYRGEVLLDSRGRGSFQT